MKSEVLEAYAVREEAEASGAGRIHFIDLLIVLARRRRFIALFTLIVAILTAAIVLMLPSRYTAVTVLMPPAQNSSVSTALMGQLSSAGGLASLAGSSIGLKNPSEMFVSLFRSRTVEQAMVQRFDLKRRYHAKKDSQALKAFEVHTSVDVGVKDGLLRVTAWDTDPNEASALANGYVDQFRHLSEHLAISEASQRRAFFEQQLLEAKGNLTTAEEALKHTEQSTGVLQIDSQARSLIESAAMLRAQIGAKEVELQGIRTYATDNNPLVVQAEQELVALRSQLAGLAGSDQDSGQGLIVPKGRVPEAGLEYLRRLRDVKYYETVSELIAKQYEIAKLDEAKQGATIQVVDLAVPPDSRSYPKRTLTVLLAAFAALLLSCTWVVFSNHLGAKTDDPEAQQRLQDLRRAWRS
jgi:tyrosine-protein kinase Etk/Wzc